MYLVDPTGRLEADFDPPTAGAEPGVSTLVRARVRATGMQWERRPRTIGFRIDATETGCPTTTATATFVQTPVFPERLLGRLVGIAAALALLTVAWVAVVRPAVRDVARDAVRGSQSTATTVAGQQPANPDESTPTVAVPATDEGTIVNIALPVNAAVGTATSGDYKVPAGRTLHITDIVVQNPNGDQGVLLVQRDNETLYTFRLDNFLGDTTVPLVTPIELRSGQKLVVTVTCGGVGDPTITTCAENVFASGRLLKA